jgi:cobyrinic acid a,c-diamide synthase
VLRPCDSDNLLHDLRGPVPTNLRRVSTGAGLSNVPRVLLAGTHSSVGKTTVTVGLLSALRRQGWRVAPFKAGPDYIDPTLHALAAGRPSRNLDAWLLPESALLGVLQRGMRGADVAVIEGVMGLFDGIGSSQDASTAAVARTLDAPVLLVLDVFGMSTTAAAVVLGCQRLQPGVRLAGAILNRVGSDAHAASTAAAIHDATGLPTLGSLPHDPSLAVPERHLGLVPAGENGLSPSTLERLTDLVLRRFDLQAIHAIAASATPLPAPGDVSHQTLAPSGSLRAAGATHIRPVEIERPAQAKAERPEPVEAERPMPVEAERPMPVEAERPAHFQIDRPLPVEAERPVRVEVDRPVRIGVAQDRAFGFYYVDTFDLLADLGAEVVPFSALDDMSLPADVDAVYLGGGFPELYAREIAANMSMRQSLEQHVGRGAPLYAECGGLMALGQTLVTLDGERLAGFGLLPLVSRMTRDRLTIGYREVEALRPTALLDRGERMRGHEFHWSTADPPQAGMAAYRLLPDGALEGYCVGSIVASYVHLSFAASPAPLARFVRAAAQIRESQTIRAS